MASIEDWKSTVRVLRERHVAFDRQLTQLEAARRPLVLAAKTGDTAAQRELDALTERQRGQERERADLALAIEEAEKRLARAIHEAEERRHATRVAEARGLVARRLAAARQVDELLHAISAAYRAYNEVGMQLSDYRDAHGLRDALLFQPEALGYALKHADEALNRQLDVRASAAIPLADFETNLWTGFCT